MAEEKKEKWLSFLATSTVIFAVFATLSTFKGGSFSTKSVIAQMQAANQWSYFQSKSIKSYLYEIQQEELAIEGKGNEVVENSEAGKVLNDRSSSYAEKIARYSNEKQSIQEEAKRLEQLRDLYQHYSQTFGMAVIWLQLSILLCSIAGLFKNKGIWAAALCMGTVGIVFFSNGFLDWF